MVEVLTSGIALGVHVPGVLLANRLRASGVPAAVTVLESLLTAPKQARAEANRAVFHADFRLARAGHRVVRAPTEDVDPAGLDALFARWDAEQPERFVVFSGFWIPLLRRYEEHAATPMAVDLCHVDSVDSPSFRSPAPQAWRTVRLADAAHRTLPTTIPPTGLEPVPWHERLDDSRVLAHGGGWGMGTYRDCAATLSASGIAVDVVVHDPADPLPRGPGDRRFAIDPAWHPWHDGGLPPFAELGPTGDGVYRRGEDHHASFALVRHAIAVAGKPGGGTLLDSLHAATPLILLDALAPHEERNARLWLDLGFAVAFRDWLDAGSPLAPLEEAHRRLAAARPGVPDYSRHLAKEYAVPCRPGPPRSSRRPR
ncbi:hypothetical protein OG216_11570 [Streptomycetaceae bacterium NBC_01309]